MRKMDTNAVEILPVRLMMSISLIAAIMGLLLLASNSLSVSLAESQVEQQCRLVQSAVSTMVGSGVYRDINEVNASEGTKRVITLELPESLMFLSFGGDPDPRNTGDRSTDILEDGSVICFLVEGGSKQLMWCPKETIRFREGEYRGDSWVLKDGGHSFLLTCGGKTTLVFECVSENHIHYILVHTMYKAP